MAGPLRHLGELARARATRRSRERADGEALRELEARPLALPAGLEVEWLGVSGYRLSYEGQTLLVDPYLSRVPFGDLLRRRPALPDPAALDRFAGGPELDRSAGGPGLDRVAGGSALDRVAGKPGDAVGVLVGHTHFDHALDAPELARRLGCNAYGSRSLVNLMGLHGLAERAVEVEPYRTYELGPFEVSFTPSAHSKLLLGLAVPYDGELSCEHLDGLCPSAYRCGQVWGIAIEVAGVRFYHQGSADLIDDAVRERGVDYFLAGIAGRNFSDDYWRRILTRLEPRAVVPTHYDDFFRPLGQPLGFVANVQLAALPEEIGAVSREIELAALPRADLA